MVSLVSFAMVLYLATALGVGGSTELVGVDALALDLDRFSMDRLEGHAEEGGCWMAMATAWVAKLMLVAFRTVVVSASIVRSSGVKAGVLCVMMVVNMCPPFAEAVCVHCHGNVDGCTGSASCPLMTGIKNNTAALVAAGVAVLTVSKVLPTRIVRALPRSVLDAIRARYNTPSAAFDFTGKDEAEVFEAALHGHVSCDEATIWLQKQLMSATTGPTIQKIAKTMDTVKQIAGSRGEVSQSLEGAHLYIWALTERCAKDTDSISLQAVEPDGKDALRANPQVKVVRPGTMGEFMRRLNIWVMILAATGVANAVLSTQFLDEVVFSLLAAGTDWKVVHELFLIYLKAISDHDNYNLGNVFASGGQDVKMREATANAAANFRGVRGEPAFAFAKAKGWNCACNMSATRTCLSYNLKQDHPTTAIDPETGKCKFKHACDRYIKGADGKRGLCGSTEHTRRECNHPDKEPLKGE